VSRFRALTFPQLIVLISPDERLQGEAKARYAAQTRMSHSPAGDPVLVVEPGQSNSAWGLVDPRGSESDGTFDDRMASIEVGNPLADEAEAAVEGGETERATGPTKRWANRFQRIFAHALREVGERKLKRDAFETELAIDAEGKPHRCPFSVVVVGNWFPNSAGTGRALPMQRAEAVLDVVFAEYGAPGLQLVHGADTCLWWLATEHRYNGISRSPIRGAAVASHPLRTALVCDFGTDSARAVPLVDGHLLADAVQCDPLCGSAAHEPGKERDDEDKCRRVLAFAASIVACADAAAGDSETRDNLLSNIVLIGNGLPDFSPRDPEWDPRLAGNDEDAVDELCADLTARLADLGALGCRVTVVGASGVAAWRGAAVLAAQDTFRDQMISATDFEERGYPVVQQSFIRGVGDFQDSMPRVKAARPR
jgi:hypothetical protein